MLKLWNRSFVTIFITNLFTANCFYILLASMPLFVVEDLQLSKSHIGLVMGAFSITGVLARPIAGFLLDNVGRRKVFITALIILFVCTSGYIVTATFAMLITIRLIHGIGWGFATTSGPTIAADIIPRNRRSEGLGYYAMTMSIGMALGPAIGVFMLDYLPFRDVFIYSSVISLTALILGIFLKVPVFEKKESRFSPIELIEKRVLGISLMLFFYGISYGSVMGFVIVYGKQLQIANSGLFFLLFAAVMLVLRPIMGKRLDISGPGHILGTGFVLMTAAMLMLHFATGRSLYFAAAVILGLGAGIIVPLLTSMAMNIVPPHRRGAANATIYACLDIGIGIGAVSLGHVAELLGISTMYLISSVSVALPIIFYYAREKKYYERSIIE